MKVLAWHKNGKSHGSAAVLETVINTSVFTELLVLGTVESESEIILYEVFLYILHFEMMINYVTPTSTPKTI